MDKRKHNFSPRNGARFLALFLSLCLGLPSSPAFALRNQTTEGAGLEEQLTRALQDDDPVKAVKTTVSRFAQIAVPPSVPVTPPVVTAGIEEKSNAPEAGWVRARVLTGNGATYDAIVLDQLPVESVPALQGGLSALLGQLNAQGLFTWVDGMGGLGAALLEARSLYPNMRPVLVDRRAWSRDQQDPAVLAELERQAQARGVNFWEKGDLPFIQKDMLRVDLVSLQEPPIRVVTMFNALHYNPDPLGILAHVYNQLPEGALLLTNLYIPTDHPEAEALAKFYGLLFTRLKTQGIADFKLTDLRLMDGVQLNHQLETGPFPEFALGLVFKKGPGRLDLQVTPVSVTFELRTVRPVVYEVAWYGEDPSVFTYDPLAAGMEEVEIAVEGPAGPIVWKVPRAVKEAIDRLSSENPTDEQGTERVRAAFDQAREAARKAEALAFAAGIFREEPGLFFWSLDHFSDPHLRLSEQERVTLSRAILYAIHSKVEEPPSVGTSPDPSGGPVVLEAGWYRFVRLLALEEKLGRIQPRPKHVEEHLDLVQESYQAGLPFSSGYTATGTFKWPQGNSMRSACCPWLKVSLPWGQRSADSFKIWSNGTQQPRKRRVRE